MYLIRCRVLVKLPHHGGLGILEQLVINPFNVQASIEEGDVVAAQIIGNVSYVDLAITWSALVHTIVLKTNHSNL